MSEKKKSFLPLFVLHCILKWPLRIHNQKLFLKPDIYNPFKIIGAIEIILRIFASGLEKKGQLWISCSERDKRDKNDILCAIVWIYHWVFGKLLQWGRLTEISLHCFRSSLVFFSANWIIATIHNEADKHKILWKVNNFPPLSIVVLS